MHLRLIGCLSFLSLGVSFSSNSISQSSSPKISTGLFSTTEVPPMTAGSKNFPEYTDDQLKGALESLLEGSSDKGFDGRHLYGFGDPNHQLSKLQSITATRILDYEAFLVRLFLWSQIAQQIVLRESISSHTFFCRRIPRHHPKNPCVRKFKNSGPKMERFSIFKR